MIQLYFPFHTLRSFSEFLLYVPYFLSAAKAHSQDSFRSWWNDLPSAVCASDSLDTFKKHLKIIWLISYLVWGIPYKYNNDRDIFLIFIIIIVIHWLYFKLIILFCVMFSKVLEVALDKSVC